MKLLKSEKVLLVITAVFLAVLAFLYLGSARQNGVIFANSNGLTHSTMVKPYLININTASADELSILEGIGEKTALSIISYRKEHGSFRKIDDIKLVSGIGEAKFQNIRDLITI